MYNIKYSKKDNLNIKTNGGDKSCEVKQKRSHNFGNKKTPKGKYSRNKNSNVI